MKNVVMMLVTGIIGALSLVIVMTICGSMNRRVEVQSNLSSAMERTLELATVEGIDDNNLALAECMETIAWNLDSESEVTMQVYQVDIRKGVLALGIIEHFKHPNGTQGETEWKRNVIYNKVKETEIMQYEVSFYSSKEDMLSEGRSYKTYVLQEGEHISVPVSPTSKEGTFAGWRDVNDYMADFSQPVEQNLAYYAAWE